LTEFIDLNLWMLFVIGVSGYLLCFFRYTFVWWIVPVVALFCVVFVGELTSYMPSNVGPPFEFETITMFRIGFSIFAALALPIAGALADYRYQYPQPKMLP